MRRAEDIAEDLLGEVDAPTTACIAGEEQDFDFAEEDSFLVEGKCGCHWCNYLRFFTQQIRVAQDEAFAAGLERAIETAEDCACGGNDCSCRDVVSMLIDLKLNE